jgi:hypothetical protein
MVMADIRLPRSSLRLSQFALQTLGAVYEHRALRRRSHSDQSTQGNMRNRAGDWSDEIVSVGALRCDLEVLYVLATLFAFERITSPPAVPTPADRMNYS